MEALQEADRQKNEFVALLEKRVQERTVQLTETNAQTIAEYRRTRFGEFTEADTAAALRLEPGIRASYAKYGAQ